MRSEESFTLKQIAWTKASKNPCWSATPTCISGQIVSSITNDTSNPNKVNFLRDANLEVTLEPISLQLSSLPLNFELVLSSRNLEENFQPFFQKSNSETKVVNNNTQSFICASFSNSSMQMFDQTFSNSNTGEKEVLEIVENTSVNQSMSNKNKLKCPETAAQMQDISDENMMNIIKSAFFKELKSSKGYTNRKEVLAIETKLKESLLAKYQLVEIPKPLETKKTEAVLPRLKSRNLQIRFSKNYQNNELIIKKSAKNLYKMIRFEMGYSSIQAKEWSYKIIQSLTEQYRNNWKQYCCKYMEMISLLKETGSVEEVGDLIGLYQEGQMFEEFYKKEDEERSKLTQIWSETN